MKNRRSYRIKPILPNWLTQATAVFLSSSILTPGALATLPQGATIVHGDVAISTAGNQMTVGQGSRYGIVDWDSFSIGAGNGVHFDNGSGATLNRVTGLTASQIDGLLSATGSLYLVNRNGIIIGPGGQVLTGGSFVASTLDISNADFLNGGGFTLIGEGTAGVTNLGKISSSGGDVFLAGYTATNSGTITADAGRAGLVAGTRIDVLTDAGWLGGAYAVSLGERGNDVTNEGRIEAMVAELRTHNGNIYALAGNNAGLIQATGVNTEGGRVILTADNGLVESSGTITAQRDGDGGDIEIEASLVHNYGGVQDVSGDQGGTIRITTDEIISDTTMLAQGTNGDGGLITIEANQKVLITSGGLIDAGGAADGGGIAIDAGAGRMVLSGTVNANGQSQGGQVSLWGESVSLLGAKVNANGGPLGGEIYVGGGYQGEPLLLDDRSLAVANSRSTYIGAGSVLSADAGAFGKGGTVVAWSDGVTQFAGTIFARGGVNGGDGGLVETSGLEGLGVDGTVDASARAAYGENGRWLLDPKNITIGTVTDSFSEFERIVESDTGFGYPTDRTGGANFGASLDVDGSTMVVGASGAGTGLCL